MRVLHLTPYYAPAYAFGGVVRSVEGMARALARRGHHVTVLTTDALSQHERCAAPADEMRDGVRVLRAPNLFPALRGRFNLSTPPTLRALAETLLADTDALHCHEFRTVENLIVTRIAAAAGKPMLLSPHGTLAQDTGRGSLKRAWDRLLSPAVARRFDHIIALTEAERREAQTLWPQFGRRRIPATFSVIPNGVDPAEYADLPGGDEFRQRYRLGGGPVCLFMGRLHARKGAALLVEAFKQVDLPDARLLIVGPDEGQLDALRQQADARTVITGYLGGAERLAAFAASDALALPAVGEGLPMVVLEGMAAGLPAIISPGCNLSEVAQHGAGIEVEPAVDQLAAALRRLLSDPAERAAMSAAARRLVEARFTWDGVATALERCYQQALDAR